MAARAGPRRWAGRAGARGRGAAARARAVHRVALLPGDGIGPEITAVATRVLELAGAQAGAEFAFTEAAIGGAALDATGVPLPDATLETCKASDAVLLAAIGGYKWDGNEPALRPERGLLALRAGLDCFANLRPAVVQPQLADASTLKREVVDGVDIMVVRELVGGIYFGEPRGIEERGGQRVGFNTMVYSEGEIERIGTCMQLAQRHASIEVPEHRRRVLAA